MSPRRLSMILRNLPIDSSYRAAIRDDMAPEQMAAALASADQSKHGRWSLEASLAARNGDLLQLMLWQNGGGKGTQPDPLPRPGVTPSNQSTPLTEAGLDYLLKTRELRGADPNG